MPRRQTGLKSLDSYAFVEGWAHYAEQMILDAGFGPNMPSRGAPGDALKAAKISAGAIGRSAVAPLPAFAWRSRCIARA